MTTPRSPKNDEYATVSFVQQVVAGLTLGTSSQTVQQIVDAAVAPLATTSALSAVAATIPALSSATPLAEATSGAAGNGTTVPRSDHQHPRLTSSTTGSTAADGTATVNFTRTFASPPGIALLCVENNTNPPPNFKVTAWITNGSNQITGCTIYASRMRVLPTLTPVSGLLTAVITGVNAIVTALSGYAPYEPAGSVSFTCIAVQTSA